MERVGGDGWSAYHDARAAGVQWADGYDKMSSAMLRKKPNEREGGPSAGFTLYLPSHACPHRGIPRAVPLLPQCRECSALICFAISLTQPPSRM